ncbi:alkaline serine protease Alp1 [Colletotrichum higginsianum]|nr:alkaline serine protease Alp1 [Colletotrichum higginsianum]
MTPLRFIALLFTLISTCLSQELPNPTSASTRTFEAKSIIWGKKGISKEDADGFYNTLVGIVGDKDKVEFVVNENKIPYVWRTALTAAQLKNVNTDGVVDSIETDDQLIVAETGSTAVANKKRADTKQVPTTENTIVDLRMLSTPPRDPLAEYYGYDDTAGEGITIYIIDSGPFGFAHSELQPPDASITRENINVMRHLYAINEDSYHGTCVASKAVGKTVGVAKRANLVTIRIDYTLGEFDLIGAWQAVLNDIKDKTLRGKAVVSASTVTYATKNAERNRELVSKLTEILQTIFSMDVPIICAAGNDAAKEGGSIEPNTLPSVLAKNKKLPIIVVGAATADGTMASFSQRGDLLTTWAVGQDVKCADYDTLDGLTTDSGTSYAAPQIGALAAYFMSNPEFEDYLNPGSIAKDMKDLMGLFSHPRGSTDDHPNIAWNGFHPACSKLTRMRRSPGAAVRRQSSRACSRPKPSLPAQPTGTATADPQCNVCGQLNKKIMRYEAGCPGADYARSSCEANSDCQSWAYGEEKQGTRSTPICIMYNEAAAEVIAGAPVDTKRKCPFKYSDRTCR